MTDHGVSHVVVRAVDAYCGTGGAPCNDGGFGWIAFDDVETDTIEVTSQLPNGSFENITMSNLNWDFSQANGAWGFGTGIGEDRQSAYEGGRMAASLLPDDAGGADEAATGEISSTGWTVLRQTLKFQLQGFDGSEGSSSGTEIRNFVEIRDGGGTMLDMIGDPPGDNWAERSVDLFALGLGVGDQFSVRVVDGSDHTSRAWIGVDYFRMEGVPEPSSMLLLGVATLLLGLYRRKKA